MKNVPLGRIWTTTETQEFYKDLLEKSLNNIPETGAVMVLGPMFIIRSIDENFKLFEDAQRKLESQGLHVFNQVPITDHMLGEAPFDYKTKFEVFYKPLIQSGKITGCYLLPDWDKSEGTKSEIEYCKEKGIPVHEL
ncbi:MAG: DUF4406 domain-containing protein [Candidatus Taylorbacteria bacterium]